MIWQIGFSAPNASSLNFLISELVLPNKAEMFILSKDGRIIHGPITSDMIYDGIYSSDIIESNEVMIYVKSDIKKYKIFNINIHGVCQGIPKPIIDLREFQDAADCNFDINCPQGNGWQNERDAVALVIKNGEKFCSGALINNQCQDLRPFFLTAFHCLDSDMNNQLNATEKNLSIYSFRFKYESGTPSCPGISTGSQGNWIIYSGALFRAANAASDFALIELNGSIINQPNIALAGWDRTTTIPTTTTIIHHPKGDAKKITIDFQPAIQSSLDGVQCWQLQVDNGATEGGTSGAPYFDQNKRIKGQHKGVNDALLPVCDRVNKFGGRFDISWTGGGTNDTRLSNWLWASSPPNTMNAIRVPSISNVGSNLVCTTNKQYTLNNLIPGKTISWSVNNTGLFATTGGASTSGTGSIATLRAASSSSSGSAVLTFVLSQSGCNNVTFTQTIWVGLPQFNLSYVDQICQGAFEIAIPNGGGSLVSNVSWTFTGAITGVGNTANAKYKGVSLGLGDICATATNACGQTMNCYYVDVNDCYYYKEKNDSSLVLNQNKVELEVVPNPFSESFQLKISNFDEKKIHIISIYDINGNIILSQHITASNLELNMIYQPTGLYFIQYINSDQILTKKIIKR